MNTKEKLVIIGANEYQDKLVLKAKEMGYETHVFAWEEGAVAKPHADVFYPISITDVEAIDNVVELLHPAGIVSIGSDLAMPTVNTIAMRHGWVGNTAECTYITTNKYAMREMLTLHGLPCPHYQKVSNFNELNLKNILFPVIVKPLDRSGSRGVTLAHTIEELKQGLIYAQSVSFDTSVLVEEYIEGREFSVESISQKGNHTILQVTEKFTTNAPHFIERGHLAPARINHAQEKAIHEIVLKALEALSIENGASHSELKIKPNGEIKIIEIAARMGGDFIGSDLVLQSTHYDFVANVIRVACNQDIQKPIQTQRDSVCVGFIFDEKDLHSFKKVQTEYPNDILESYCSDKLQTVADSSTRNGYFIMKLNPKTMNSIFKTMGFEGVTNQNVQTTQNRVFLFILVLFFSVASLLSKLASNEQLFSLSFFVYYGLILGILFVYALGWQKVLKHTPLNIAYSYRSLLILWGMVWGLLFFQETLQWNRVLGSLMVIFGLSWVNKDE